VADYIYKLVTGKFDFSDSIAGALKLLSGGMAKSFVSIKNSNNENNNENNDDQNTSYTSTTKTTSITEVP
jgi:hypothetical protein